MLLNLIGLWFTLFLALSFFALKEVGPCLLLRYFHNSLKQSYFYFSGHAVGRSLIIRFTGNGNGSIQY